MAPHAFDADTPLETLVATLGTTDYFARQAAAKELRRRGEPGITLSASEIVATLAGDTTQVRVRAALVLREFGDMVPADVFVHALDDDDKSVRAIAARALSEAGARVPEAFWVSRLESADPVLRAAALRALGARMHQGILLAAIHDPEWTVHDSVSEIAFALGKHVPVAGLIEALGDGSNAVRAAAAEALAYLPGDMLPLSTSLRALDDPDEDVRRYGVVALANLGNLLPAERLRACLDDPSVTVRWEAAKALTRVGDPVGVDFIVGQLRADHEYARENALSAICSGLHAERAQREIARQLPIAILLELLRDAYWPCAIMAADLIGDLGDAAPVAELLALLDNGQAGTRWAALRALRESGHTIPVGHLLRTLHDEDASVRRESALALDEQREEVPVEMLLPLIEEHDATIALILARRDRQAGIDALVQTLGTMQGGWAASRALGELGSRAPAEPLVAALGDSDVKVAVVAAEALRATHPEACTAVVPELIAVLHGGEIGPILEPMLITRAIRAVSTLGLGTSALVSLLGGYLDHSHWEVRLLAAHALRRASGDLPTQVADALEQLKRDPESPDVRRVAAMEQVGA